MSTTLGTVDLLSLIIYFTLVIGLGIYLARKAAGSMTDYFLGGKTIPWYLLGISGMATYVGLGGSMLAVSLFNEVGLKAFWIFLRGNACLFLPFLMLFVGKWLCRSGVMTNAEWMKFRFGNGFQGKLARTISAVSILVMASCLVGLYFLASGKFLSIFFPYPPELCAAVFMTIVVIYTVTAGFLGVVYTDLLQSLLVIALIIFVGFKVMFGLDAGFFEQNATADWLTMTNVWNYDMPEGYKAMEPFGFLIMFWFLSNLLQGLGMPLDSWTAQRFYAARNERESSMVGFGWIVFFTLGFALTTGFGILSLGISDTITDPEMALPAVINEYIPLGLRGIAIAALVAAAMSSLDSFANSASAYFVNDIYKVFFRKTAGNRELVWVSYAGTFGLFAVGISIGFFAESINNIWSWIVMGFITGMLAPNILKWFWWRLNGAGFCAGVGGGVLGALIKVIFFPEANEIFTFLFVFCCSAAATLLGTLLTQPTSTEVLRNFFTITRPYGFWGEISRQASPEIRSEIRTEARRNFTLLPVAIVWQLSLLWCVVTLLAKTWGYFGFGAILVTATSLILYVYWYKRLEVVNK